MDDATTQQTQDPTGDYLKDFASKATLANMQNYIKLSLQKLDEPQQSFVANELIMLEEAVQELGNAIRSQIGDDQVSSYHQYADILIILMMIAGRTGMDLSRAFYVGENIQRNVNFDKWQKCIKENE